jgi:hypothetical protein
MAAMSLIGEEVRNSRREFGELNRRVEFPLDRSIGVRYTWGGMTPVGGRRRSRGAAEVAGWSGN